jgi:Tol biopolymer transport system component
MHLDDPKTASVWVSRIDGAARKRVLPNARRPRWLDDHTLIYEPPDLRSVWALDLHTRRTRKLFDWRAVTTNGYAGSLELSPDRKHILSNPQKGHWGPTADVFVCDLDGRNVRTVWEDPDWPNWTNGTTDTCLVWLAGDRFAWCRHARLGNRVPDMAIVTCYLGETNFQALTPWIGYNFPLAGSPDGRRILFLTEDVPGGGNLELWTMNVDGTDRRKVLERKFGCDSGITARWVRCQADAALMGR